MKKIPIEVSARHVHLSQEDLERLFGSGYRLKKMRALTLPGEFAAKEEIRIKTKEGELSLRIISPTRKDTQVELSISDAIELGIKPVLRVSGDIKNTSGAVLIGPKAKIQLKRGVIIAQRHIHCTLEEAKGLGSQVSVRIKGKRELVFGKVRVRKSDKYKLVMHVDTDEGNAALINKRTIGYL